MHVAHTDGELCGTLGSQVSPTAGTEVYSGDAQKFIDTDLNKGVWYYYAAYTKSKSQGWSLPSKSAGRYLQYDAEKVGTDDNYQNYARGMRVTTNADYYLVYGEGYRAVDGNNGRGCATTSYNAIMRFNPPGMSRPGGSMMWIQIDLKKTRAISKANVYQTGDKHFHSNKFRMYSTEQTDRAGNGQSWRYTGQWSQNFGSSYGGAKTAVSFARRNALHLSFYFWPSSYYFGVGEVQVYY